MTYELKQAYAEVYEVLKNMPKEYVNKIPNKIINLLETSKLENYKIEIDKQNVIDRTKLSKQTMTIIAMLNYQYWCPNNRIKNELYKKYLSNEENYQKELEEKYNIDNLFKDRKKEKNSLNGESQALIRYKEKTLIQKILDRIKSFFRLTK